MQFLRLSFFLCSLAFFSILQAQTTHRRGHRPPPVAPEDPAAVARGRAQFGSTCGFCHGTDATGARAPDLVRSAILSHDEKGNLVIPVIRNGRPEKGMPAFPNLTGEQVSDIIAFLHYQQFEALHSGRVASSYPVSKLLTGSAAAGKAFFYGSGGCSGCHSVTGDLAGIAKKLTPLDLQQQIVYPSQDARDKTAVVTLANGTRYEGKLVHEDEFRIGLICRDGWYRSWPLDRVKVDVHDPLAAHRKLTTTYTDAEIHNLFAFLETLK